MSLAFVRSDLPMLATLANGRSVSSAFWQWVAANTSDQDVLDVAAEMDGGLSPTYYIQAELQAIKEAVQELQAQVEEISIDRTEDSGTGQVVSVHVQRTVSAG